MRVIVEHDATGENINAITRALQTAITVAALDLQALAAERAPVDTSFLQNSIHAQIDPDNPYAEVVVDAEYGRPVEEGHETRSGSQVAAQQYMAPSVAEIEAALPQVIPALIRKELGQ